MLDPRTPLFSEHAGMTEEESKPLIDWLNNHCIQPEFSCRVRWEPDTVTIGWSPARRNGGKAATTAARRAIVADGCAA